MGSPPASPPPPPPPSDASASPFSVKRTRKASRLRLLSTRPPGVERPVVHVDPATGKADGPHRKKLRTYLGIVARDKVDATYENWKENLISQRLLTIGRKGSYFRPWGTVGGNLNQTSRGNGPLQPIRTVSRTLSVRNTTSTRKSGPSFARLAETLLGRMSARRHRPSRSRILPPHVLSRGGYDYLEQKLLAEKTKKKLEEAAQSRSVDGIIDPPSLVRRHVKWKMAHTKKTGDMTTEVAKEIAEKIVSHFQLTITIIFQYFVNAMYHCVFSVQDSFEEQATQGSFVPHGCQDVLAAAIGRPEHLGRVRAAGAGVTIKQYFGSAPRTSRSSSSLPPEELQQLTQQIRDQLEESITERGLAVPPDPLVRPSDPQVSIKGSCVDPSRNDPETGDSDRCDLYIEVDPARLVAMGRVYEESTVVHNTPLLPGQVKVSVEDVTDADAPVPVPTDEVSLVGLTLHTFLAWPTHLVKSLSQQVAVSSTKPTLKPDLEVDDPLYLMTLTIPELFLRPYQVRWDATVFEVFNPDFAFYIKHEDLSEIAHGGQCLSILVHLIETCMRAGNSDIYRFLEPQSIQRSGQSQFESESYIKTWIGHWQVVVILPKKHLVVWFCSLHNRPDNYLKGIINSALKGLDDAPQPKSKAPARWIVAKYFNNPRPLEPEKLKALWIQ
ncbi:hypothetical protein GmHk_07G019924 [Glycine max]|nr:hypothetical protein GmHk_07G019924 [Glycine max]